jgi:tRNA(His) guanylyltransferase
MGHNQTDIRMKSFEVYREQTVPPESYIVVRLDGVGFSKFTEVLGCEKPFDPLFMERMRSVTAYLMTEVPDIEIGYVQSDEITLVFKRDTEWFRRRVEKFVSVLAAKASSKMALLVNQGVPPVKNLYPAFDCRLSVFPTRDHVNENLTWRIEDSVKNCRNLIVFWGMVHSGVSARAATSAMRNKGKDFYNEWMFLNLGINFKDFDAACKRGTLFYKAEVNKAGFNPSKRELVVCHRQVMFSDPLPDTRLETPLAFVARRQQERLAESQALLESDVV